jgi:hypothetical protein
MAIIISLDGKTKLLETGESYTFNCAGQRLSSTGDLTVTFNTAGYLAYNGLVTVGNYGNSRTFACKGKKMVTDIVITADEYGKTADSPLPIEIDSESKMNALLQNATYESVGAIYKYTGGYSSTYEYGELYIIAEEDY